VPVRSLDAQILVAFLAHYLGAVPMRDVLLFTPDGGEPVMPRYTQPEPERQILYMN
jgi:hypothetical protein